jgi:hypothetical protein
MVSDKTAVFLGVNRAVELVGCDYWVALDAETFTDTHPRGDPLIITREQTARKIYLQIHKSYAYPPRDGELPDKNTAWLGYSSLAAMVAAYDLGCTKIKMFGCDMCGVEDWDGKQVARVRRDESRWKRERKHFQKLFDWLTARGVTVERC